MYRGVEPPVETGEMRVQSRLLAEKALLRHQLIILRRQTKRPIYRKTDRLLLVLLARMVQTRIDLFPIFLLHASLRKDKRRKRLPSAVTETNPPQVSVV